MKGTNNGEWILPSKARIDTFDFRSYVANKIHVIEGEKIISYKTIYFNPFLPNDIV